MIQILLISSVLLILSSCTQHTATQPVETTPSSAQPVSIVTPAPVSEAIYVDVREDEEWAAWHIAGAIHVRLGDIEAGKVDALPKDRDIILYCRSGRRSAIAMNTLKNLGFTRVSDAWGMTSVPWVNIVQ